MKTIREQIIERIINQLKTITINNGYHSDIGTGAIYRQEAVTDKGYTPAISVWELIESRERNSYGGTVRLLTIKIEAMMLVNGDKHPATVSNELLGDIEKALIMGNTTLDELIDDIQDIAAEISQLPFERALAAVASEDNAQITPLPINRKLASATLDFEIKYTTEWGDPYTQHE